MEDLLFVRDQIKALEKLEDRDPILKYHREAMTELRRVAQAKINIMRKSTVPEEDQDLGD
jgi:hypothetical protein